jgi:anti-sigma B factor antagonist
MAGFFLGEHSMGSNGVDLRVEQDADVTIISILASRVPVEMSDSFEERVVQAVERLEQPKVLIDFADVSFISSAVLGKLIKLNGRVQDRGGQFRISALGDRIAEVFHITGLDRLFQIYDTRDDAIRAFE